LIRNDQSQPRRARVDCHEVASSAERVDPSRAGAVRCNFCRWSASDLVRLPARRLEVESDDEEAEQAVVQREVDEAHRQQQQRPRRLAEAQHVVEQAGRETKTEVHVDRIHQRHRRAGQRGVNRVQHWRQEHERELDRLGHASKE
jgi:hypothetical protein